MLTSLAATTLLAVLPSPAEVDVLVVGPCTLQDGAEWGEGEDVAAVVCDGRPGFFVPSLEFRALRDPTKSEPYRLLEQELRLAKEEIGELRSADKVADDVIGQWKGLAREYRTNWIGAEHDVQEMEGLVVEASKRELYESPVLWFVIGAVTVVAVVVALEVRDR